MSCAVLGDTIFITSRQASAQRWACGRPPLRSTALSSQVLVTFKGDGPIGVRLENDRSGKPSVSALDVDARRLGVPMGAVLLEINGVAVSSLGRRPVRRVEHSLSEGPPEVMHASMLAARGY